MTRDYIPTTDADADTWATNFDSVITANPTNYGLVAGQATAFHTLRLAFTNALAAAVNPATRTSVTVATKDTARSAMVTNARSLGQVARKYPGVTAALLSTAGLTVPDPIPSTIPAPSTQPVVSVDAINPLQHVLRFKDSVIVNPRSKPAGVTGCHVYVKVGTTPPGSIADCVFKGTKTRVPFTIDFAAGDVGKTAYYLASWVNAKGEEGPVSALTSATVAG